MNITAVTPSATQAGPHPDFSGRPRRIKLDQVIAIKGIGKLVLRPIHLLDEKEMAQLHHGILNESIYLRYFEHYHLDWRTVHERLVRICTNIPESYAIVAERTATAYHPMAILAIGRLTTTSKPFAAAFATLITDQAQPSKLPKVLLTRLIKIAQAFGFRTLNGELLVADHDTLNLCRALDFSLQTFPQNGLVRVTLDL